MSAPRFNDWQLRFEALVRERMALPFAWGSNDCVLFAADAVQALTGERLLPELRGHRSLREAVAVLRQVGGVDEIATRALGPAIPPLMATVGDVVLVTVGKRQALGVCNGDCVLGPSRCGLLALPMNMAQAAWRVG